MIFNKNRKTYKNNQNDSPRLKMTKMTPLSAFG
jgi:hypothetical protein